MLLECFVCPLSFPIEVVLSFVPISALHWTPNLGSFVPLLFCNSAQCPQVLHKGDWMNKYVIMPYPPGKQECPSSSDRALFSAILFHSYRCSCSMGKNAASTFCLTLNRFVRQKLALNNPASIRSKFFRTCAGDFDTTLEDLFKRTTFAWWNIFLGTELNHQLNLMSTQMWFP